LGFLQETCCQLLEWPLKDWFLWWYATSSHPAPDQVHFLSLVVLNRKLIYQARAHLLWVWLAGMCSFTGSISAYAICFAKNICRCGTLSCSSSWWRSKSVFMVVI
jgi:hypothetical protein